MSKLNQNPTNFEVCLERMFLQSIIPCDCGCNMPFVCLRQTQLQDARRAEKLANVEAKMKLYEQDVCYWCVTLQFCSSKTGKINHHRCIAL